MGNIQAGDAKSTKTGKSKGLKIIRGKRGKAEEPQFLSIVPEDSHQNSSENDVLLENDEEANSINYKTKETSTPKAQERTSPQSGESSSDSVFTDPQTPVGFSTEINQCYYSEESVLSDVEIPDTVHDNFSHNFALNSFKLNEHKFKREKILNDKLSKLGISKTSQISLEAEPNESFCSGNVEVVTKNWKSEVSGESGICIDGGEFLKFEDSDMSPKEDDCEKTGEYTAGDSSEYSSPVGT